MNDEKSVALARLIKQIDEEWPHQLGMLRLQAKMLKARYDELKKVGFSDAEALDLCWRKGEF